MAASEDVALPPLLPAPRKWRLVEKASRSVEAYIRIRWER